MLKIVIGAGRRGKVEDGINRAGDIDILADVMLDEAEPVVPIQMGDIVHAAGNKIIHADDRVPLGDEAVA